MGLQEMIETAMHEAIAYLAKELQQQLVEAKSHHTLIITGWNSNEDTRRAIAHYLVGLRISAIDLVLRIRADLIEESSQGRADVWASVCEVIGEDTTSLSDNAKDTERNPWIAEALWHLCMTIAQRRIEFHPRGTIIALNPPHIAAKDHGLDGTALYQAEGGVGLTIIESKAYKNQINGAISDAVAFFRAVDKGDHDTRIRQTVQQIRGMLSDEVQPLVTAGFWRSQRCYIPNPHYDESEVVEWANTRPALGKLAPGRDHVIVMPHSIANYDEFFEQVAHEMREFARGIQNV